MTRDASTARVRIDVPYTGSHKKVTVYSVVTDCGRRFFRTYGTRFNAEMFIRYVTEMKRRFRKVAVVLGRTHHTTSKI